jgi:prolyl 4-hydroxylase
MNKRRLDDSWKGWLKENIERKCNPEELLGILLKNNFTQDSIEECMGDLFPADSPLLQDLDGKSGLEDVDHKAISRARIARLDSGLNAQQLLSDKLQLYTIDNFMSDEECDVVVELMQSHLRPSTLTRDPPDDKYFRTSSTCDLSLLKDKRIEKLDERIARAVGIRLPYSEGIQGQHYEVGQEFKKHTDYFEPGTDEYVKFAGDKGNRTWTFMIYLNTAPRGGGTRFFQINHTFQPQKGKAVIWNSLHPDGLPNYDTLHAGLPVTEGHKDIITKWFRERGRGAMFY